MTPDTQQTQTKSEMVGARVTADEYRQIKRVSEIRDTSISKLLRQFSVDDLLAEHDRMVSLMSSSSES